MLALTLAATGFASIAQARIQRISIDTVVVTQDGQHESITGQAYGELDPTAPLNAVITDIGLRREHLHSIAPSSLLGEALHYLHGQWPKLVKFLDSGAWLLNSNPVENAIRPFVVGRRSWLFADTVGGATRCEDRVCTGVLEFDAAIPLGRVVTLARLRLRELWRALARESVESIG